MVAWLTQLMAYIKSLGYKHGVSTSCLVFFLGPLLLKARLDMSKMSALALEVETLLDQDVPPKMIAIRLGVSVNFVYDVVESIQDNLYNETDPFKTINS
jgi:hypothetical protein